MKELVLFSKMFCYTYFLSTPATSKNVWLFLLKEKRKDTCSLNQGKYIYQNFKILNFRYKDNIGGTGDLTKSEEMRSKTLEY